MDDRDVDELLEMQAREAVRTAMDDMQAMCPELQAACDDSWMMGAPEPFMEPNVFIDPAVDYAPIDMPIPSDVDVSSWVIPNSNSASAASTPVVAEQSAAEPAPGVAALGSSEPDTVRIARAMGGPRRAKAMLIRDSFAAPALVDPRHSKKASKKRAEDSDSDDESEDGDSSPADVDSSSTPPSSGSAYSSTTSFGPLGDAAADAVAIAAPSAASMAAVDVMPGVLPAHARPCQKGLHTGAARPAVLLLDDVDGNSGSIGMGGGGISSAAEPGYDPAAYGMPPSFGYYGAGSSKVPLRCMLKLAPQLGSDMCQASVLRLQDAMADLHDVRTSRGYRPFDYDMDGMGPAPLDSFFYLLPLLVLLQVVLVPVAIIKAAKRRAAAARANRVFTAIHADSQLKAAVEAAAREAVPEPQSARPLGELCQRMVLGAVAVVLSFLAISCAVDALFAGGGGDISGGSSSMSSSSSGGGSGSDWPGSDPSSDDSDEDLMWYRMQSALVFGLWWLGCATVLVALTVVFHRRRSAADAARTEASAPPSDDGSSGSGAAARGVPVDWHPAGQPYAYAPMAQQATTGTGVQAEGTYAPPAMQTGSTIV